MIDPEKLDNAATVLAEAMMAATHLQAKEEARRMVIEFINEETELPLETEMIARFKLSLPYHVIKQAIEEA